MLCLLVIAGATAYSQVSPVQVVPAVFAPYSTLLSEYYSGTSTRLSVTLINTDFNEPQLKVYLRMTIEGQGVKLQSNLYGNYPAIELTPGLPVTVSQSDLAPYFNVQNLAVAASAGGLRPQVRLPEGYYQFSFEAIEVHTGRVVGNKQSAQAYLTLSDPPFLTMPEKGKVVSNTNPMNLLFQWTPRHLNNPNAFNTEYTFDLVEIWDEGLAPEAAFYTSKPIYSTTLNTTNLFYGPGEPQLIVGKRYAWRIQATLVTGNNEQEPFRNDGYSEIYWFKLQGDCPPLQKADIVSDPHNNKTRLSWTADLTSIGGYKLDYRKKGNATWTTVDAASNTTTLTGLSWNTEYEYRLANRCVITDEYVYGGLQTFRTLNQDTTRCVPSTPKAIANTAGIDRLVPGDTIYASGFRMRLTKVTGAAGQFSGEGYISLLVPTTTTEVSVKAAFQNIRVNTDKELFAGRIVSIYDRTEGGIANVDEFFEGGQGVGSLNTGATADIAVNTIVDASKKATITTIASSDIEASYEVTVTGTDGKPVTLQVKKFPAIIQDKAGKIYTIDKEGNIQRAGSAGVAQQQILAGKGPEQLNKLNTDKATVTFHAHPAQTYAFDTYLPAYNKSALFSQQYESLVQGTYRVANKLLVTGSTDKVLATISNPGKDINTDSIHFITGKGIELAAVKTAANTYEVTLLAGPQNDVQELYAVYRDTKAAQVNKNTKIDSAAFTYSLGKLNIATYGSKEFNVKLVPVGTAAIDEHQVEKKLNEIYNPVGISWNVSKAAPFTDMSWDTNKDGRLDVKDAGKNNKYSAEMQALNLAYTATGIDAATPYLFVFNTAPLNAAAAIQGDMLRNHQFGYLFTPLTDAGTVAAHEMAHGVFHLNHTFDTQYRLSEGELADNLMDYRGGTNLVKLQWDAIHAPGLVVGVFEKEDDGKSVIVQDLTLLKPFLNKDGNSFTFITPAGRQFSLPSDIKKIAFYSNDESNINGINTTFYPDGALRGFTLQNGVVYSSNYMVSDNEFAGYYYEENKSGDGYIDVFTMNLSEEDQSKAIIGTLCIYEGEPQFLVKRLQYNGVKISADHNGSGPYLSELPISIPIDYDPQKVANLKYISTTPYGTLASEFISKNSVCDGKYARYILTLANLVNANEDYVKNCFGFTSFLNQYVINPGCSTCVNNVPVRITEQDYKDKIVFFLEQLNQLKKLKPLLENTNASAETLSALFKDVIPCTYTQLTAKQRVNAIKILVKEPLYDCNGVVFNNCSEVYLERIFVNTPVSQIDSVLAEINTEVVKKLFGGLGSGVNGRLGANIVYTLFDWLKKTADSVSTDSEIYNAGLLFNMFNYTAGHAGTYNTSELYQPLSEWHNENIDFYISERKGVNLHKPEDRASAKWNDWVIVRALEDLNYGDDLVIPKGTSVRIPAFYLHYMIMNAVKQYTASVTREAFDFVMIGSGVGGVFGGATELTFAIAVADIVVGSADLVISSTEQDIINWLGAKKGKEVLNLWTDVTAIYGSGVTVRAVTPWLYSKSLLLHNHLQTIDWTKVPGTVNPSTVRSFKLYKVKLEKIFGGAGSLTNSLEKLIGKASSENIIWKNIDDANIIWANPNSNVLSTAKTFANEIGTSLYDAVLIDGYYVKFDLYDGRILLGNTNGNYHAFAVLNDADLGTFKTSVLNANDELFNTKLSQLLSDNAEKLKVLSGVTPKQLIIDGKAVNLSSTKVNTLLGRFDPELRQVFYELGSFKNIGLGETKGGINLLNKPDYYYNKITWWNSYNKPWLDRAITRGDDIFIATEIRYDKLFDVTKNEITSFGNEMKLLMDNNYKPLNLTETEWEKAKIIINQVFK